MIDSTKPPRKLYKFRSFDVHTLSLMADHQVSYTDPTRFNDPMDCKPSLTVDSSIGDLEKLLSVMSATPEAAKHAIDDAKYYAGQPDDFDSSAKDGTNAYVRMLTGKINDLLRLEMSKHGVFVLAERWNCPLMWSHYADIHRGVCVEFDTLEHSCRNLAPINYGVAGSIKSSELVSWKVNDSLLSKAKVFNTYFFSKTRDWHYEREWRDIITPAGVHASPFMISSVYFGLRCDYIVVRTVMQLLELSERKVQLYKMHRKSVDGELDRSRIDCSELKALGNKVPPWWDFRGVDLRSFDIPDS